MKKRKAVLNRKPSSPSEKEIEYSILHWLNLQTYCVAWKNENTAVYDPKIKSYRKNNHPYRPNGVPDILGIWRTDALAVEVKTPVGYREYARQKKQHVIDQKAFLDRFERHGGISICTYSIQDLEMKLKIIDRQRGRYNDKFG